MPYSAFFMLGPTLVLVVENQDGELKASKPEASNPAVMSVTMSTS